MSTDNLPKKQAAQNDVGLFSQAWVDKVEMLLENVKRGTAS